MTDTTMEMDKLFEALAKAQATLTSPPRNREVEVRGTTRTGKDFTYKFRYATLDAIIDHVRGPLTEHGLWFIQTLQNGDGKYKLVTRLTHSSGQYIESETPLLVDAANNQAFGSALTYMRRYALSAILGVAADEDDDANRADGNNVTRSKDRSPAPGAAVRSAGANALAKDRPGTQPPGPKQNTPPMWSGPLAREELSAQIEKFCGELAGVTDASELDGLLAGYSTALDQVKKDAPKWWNGSPEKPGIFARIEGKRKATTPLI